MEELEYYKKNIPIPMPTSKQLQATFRQAGLPETSNFLAKSLPTSLETDESLAFIFMEYGFKTTYKQFSKEQFLKSMQKYELTAEEAELGEIPETSQTNIPCRAP